MSRTGLSIEVPEAPPVPGLTFRHWRGPGEDLPGMAAANQLARDDAGVEEVINLETMTSFYSHLTNCDLDRDLMVVELDGRTIGYVRVEWRDLTNGTRQFFSLCVLEPAQRRRRIGQAMLSWSERQLAEIVAAVPDDRPGQLFGFTYATDLGGKALLEKNGWAAVARGYEMVRPTLHDVPEITLPDGLTVRAVTETERRKIWEAAREAFRDERDQQEWSEEDWARFPEELPDTSLWVIAFDGAEVAGGILNSIDKAANAHHGRARGALASVWTGARWRRRGLAKALIARSLKLLRERGMTSAYLGVDGANPNQAMDLYASMGFEVATSTIDWRKPLVARGDAR
ncbi:MAG TPA: GNAT family N-acetyltransferase [Candidatus Limnocylindrales bacterium]|jgi:ribosomal protein S18 acetylase RimI-like enzyme|nr:GNAT family N-acetyltransferase [Candidatus Limnocylindrales bacterium]